ncbi:MAG TPA: M1 family aminopeptidase [Bryobacteraceae bacterium]|nr:M1 family aminopeptidase [Bryobacteraceae bacterium]
MPRILPALIFLATLQAALCPAVAMTATQLGDEIQRVSLDPTECYRVIDVNFTKEDIKVYLASGYLIFTKPVEGARLGAFFVATADGGDADILLLPPTRSERASLATFTKSPNLDEHFKSAALVFTDGTGEELLAQLQANAAAKKSPEMGGIIDEHWGGVLRNLMASFETRLVYDMISADRATGIFYLAVSGDELNNFDVLYDPTAQDQIVVGKLDDRNNRTIFNTWTAFSARSFRAGKAPRGAHYNFDHMRIEATIQPDLTMQAVTRGTLTFDQSRPRTVVPFSLSPNMRVTGASIDGQAVEIFDRDSLRSNLIQSSEDRQFLLVATHPLDPGAPHEIEIHHEGAVIRDAGNQVYYVGSRGTWYPRGGAGLSDYDLTFRYPKGLTVAVTGSQVNDRIEGDWRITHVKTETPVRFAGFNLGNFQSVVREHNGYRIEMYANHQLEAALQPKTVVAVEPPEESPFRRIRPRPGNPLSAPRIQGPPDPAARMAQLTNTLESTLDFMTEEFGPSPIRDLAVTPIPGGFGQGFPGLVYLSTLAYLDPAQLPPGLRERSEQTFYTELLETHEVAHQWWGNLVVPVSDRDNWLIEALANYSALLLLERKKGIKAVDEVLDQYRNHLLSKTPDGRTLESAGPIVWGYRLESSLAPDAWRVVTYEKGTWIVHMLRRRLGDEKFIALLREVANRHHSISTEDFRELARHFAPPTPDPDLKTFFDNWVYGTGIPSVKLTYAWRAGRLSGSLVGRDVDDAFTAYVPVEVQARSGNKLYWLAAGSDPVAFSIPLKTPPARVALLANDSLMTISK